MSIVAEFTIPPEAVPGGKTLTELSGASIHLERLVPSGERAFPFFWIFNADPEAFCERLRREPELEAVTVLAEIDDRALCKAEWKPSAEIFQGIKTLQATILEARGTENRWLFRVRAENRERLSAFQRIFNEQGIPVEVQRIYDFVELVESGRPLTPEQREVLMTAYEQGYFDQPRKTTQSGLGEQFGITGRAVSDRLRRGTKNLIGSTLLDPAEHDASNDEY